MPRVGSNKGYKFQDYVEQAFTVVEVAYDIGTAAYQALPTVFGKKDLTNYYANFLAETIMFYCDEDCYVRFNNSSAVQIFIPASTFITYGSRIWRLYIQRATADGTLQVWSEGDFPTN